MVYLIIKQKNWYLLSDIFQSQTIYKFIKSNILTIIITGKKLNFNFTLFFGQKNFLDSAMLTKQKLLLIFFINSNSSYLFAKLDCLTMFFARILNLRKIAIFIKN